jgi:hypothetical protein
VTDILLQIGANFDGADKVNEQLNKIDRSLVDSVRAINRFDKEFKTLSTATKNQKLTQEGFNKALQQSVTRLLDTSTSTDRHTQSMERNTATMQRGQRVTLQTGSAQQVLRQRFLETANSIAVLDGPLGGVASRFSAFGVLIGRTGVLLAGVLTGFAALGFVVRQGVRDFSEYETSMARINSVLELTGNRAGLTSSQIRGLSESIALNSLQSSQAVREASAQLLTFGNIAGDTFKEVLTLASDMAALGFGTLQSESLKLAKAIEDPRQSLASLSRSGITFTRQQRSVILSLIETGRAGEATARILEAVRNQVGGAAAREAETFAGSLDTIAQAYGVMFRTLGQGVAGEGRFFRQFIDEAARLSKVIVDSVTPFTDSEDIRKGIEELEQLKNIIDVNKQSIEDLQDLIQSGQIEPEIGVGAILSLREATSDAEKRIASLTDKIGDGLVEGLSASQIAANNLSEAMSEVESSIRSSILDTGLTSLESYVQSAIRAANATAAVEENVDGIGDAFIRTKTIEFLVKEAQSLENNIRRATDAFHDSNAAAQAQLEFVGQTGREAAVLQTIRENQLRVEAEILRLEEQKLGASEEEISNINRQQQGLRGNLAIYERTAESARELARQTDIMAQTKEAIASSTNLVDSLNSELEILTLQRNMIEQGKTQQEIQLAVQRAQIQANIAIEQAEINRLKANENLTIQMRAQLAIRAAELNLLSQAVDAGKFDPVVVPSGGTRGGGGPSGPSAIERVNELFDSLERENNMRRQLIGTTDEQAFKIEREFKLKEQINKIEDGLAAQYEDRITRMVEEEAALRKLADAEKERQTQIQRFESIMENALMSMIDGSKSVENAFRNMIRAILAEIVKDSIVKPIAGAFSSFLFNANGNAFRNGNVVPFAKGGVVDGPTMFPMRGSKTGLMGEAGPEAIMPLKRGRDGSLGVVAEGASGTVVNQTFSFNLAANGDESVKRIVAQAAPQIVEAAKSGVLDARRRGGAFRSTFG